MAVDEDSVLTGDLADPLVWGGGKANAVQALAQSLEVDLPKSFFYADGDEDAALMHLVGHPRPVNPRRHLAVVAERRGWPVLKIAGTPSLSTFGRVRNAVGMAAIAPAIAAGAGVGLVRRDKRAGLNTMIPTWISLLFAATGVKVDVVVGAKHLRQPRPAVFIFNHRNNWDSFIAMRLVGTDVTGVAKKELQKDPLFRTVADLMDVVFVDRSDSTAAVEQMKSLEQLAASGLSVIVAPEGQRSLTGELGEFKKGAFRLAMAAKIPLIPIVIRNADVLGARDTTAIRPGKVEVAVLQPVSVEDWTLDDLEKRIDGVRQLYVDTLADWPSRP
jgi:putative phosphoserine phosphatase/1-acylglycerol-3-phosphate O-acyltransferase